MSMTDFGFDIASITGLTQDSRKVKPGYLFAALKGEKSDGRDFIDQAIKSGAKAILLDSSSRDLIAGSMDAVVKPRHDGIEFVYSDNPRQTFARIAAAFYGKQPARIVAVTGTNGKTSVVHFAKQIWAALGYHAENMGTLSGAMTTPYPVAIHEKLAALADNGVTHLALEASSHGLDQYRLDGVNIKAAGFTNLSRDHLDYHADMDAYLAAKSRLFNGLLGEGDVAVLNADIPEYERLTTQTKARVLSYGRKGEDLKILSITPTETGQDCEFKINNETHRIDINLVGEFQIYNLLCALGLVLSEGGINAEKAVKTLEKITGVRGRLEFVSGHPRGAGIYIDYAHTPDALENVLNALRPHTSGNLVCLFGCGGDRDTGKRPQMGDIATRLADRVVITDDNPRSEDPAAIRAAIMAAAPDAREIPDRRKAINHCVSSLQSGDVLLVAGKGHEQGQILAGQTLPFDDVSEVRSSINNM